MSLRYQINIRILIFSLCVLSLGGLLIITQARNAVRMEVDSSINFAVQLIKIGFTHSQQTPADWLSELNTLKKTRHLKIQLKQASGQIQNVSPVNSSHQPENIPPQWFIKLVEGQGKMLEYPIVLADGRQLGVIIQANPLDEIAEVWHESLAFLSVFLFLTGFSFLAVNLAFHHAVKAINVIIDTLKRIETGQYNLQLPEFSIKEYDSIATAINQLTSRLEAARIENRALTLHSMEIQEDERKRLAQELHDELGQSVTAIKVMAIALKRSPTVMTNNETNDTIIKTCDHLMMVIRSMMHQLHPLVLTELGLKASLEDLLNHWKLINSMLSISLNCDDAVNTLKANIAIQVFRVIQECLTNIVRHSGANKASVVLLVDKTQLLLEVDDNGLGYHEQLADQEQEKTGFGILGMRERIHSLGGELIIDSSENKGMCVRATIPIS